jgi:signal transduction histidine kinase
MTPTRTDTPAAPATAPLLERLRAHRTLSGMPTAELQWLVDHGTLERFTAGETMLEKGGRVPGMYVILSGRVSNLTDRGGTWRKAMTWCEGDVTGYLPYSRMEKARGRTVVDESGEALLVPRDEAAALPVACPQLTGVLVHAMVDRTREFRSSDLQVEKLASLGKLAAGIAHEINNPTSAALRSARLLHGAFAEADEAARELEAAGLSSAERATLAHLRALALAAPATPVSSPLEQADREVAIADWLTEHDVDEMFAADLAETPLKLEALVQLSGVMQGPKLHAAVRSLAAACMARGLARDIEQALCRVHDLVSAVKGFTYMDQASVPEPVDVPQGLRDTIAVLGAKARAKAVELEIEVATNLPTVHAVGAELNQVWASLIDNAIDAVAEGGRVTVAALHQGPSVVVRVIDDGPGIPTEVERRIFDPFFTTKPVGTGTGLGLDIAQRLVARHEGLISVTSEPGRTEFCVTLPLNDPRGATRGSGT